jgi:hypothetical protein
LKGLGLNDVALGEDREIRGITKPSALLNGILWSINNAHEEGQES